MDIRKIINTPVITERATTAKEKENKYTFFVHLKANKNQIKEAVEKLFNVEVERVYTSILPGKLRRLGRYSGYRPARKKAIIQVKKGQEIKWE